MSQVPHKSGFKRISVELAATSRQTPPCSCRTSNPKEICEKNPKNASIDIYLVEIHTRAQVKACKCFGYFECGGRYCALSRQSVPRALH